MKKLSFIVMVCFLALGLTQCKKNDEPLVIPLTIPLTLEALTDGSIVVCDPQSGMQYSLNGGPKTTMGGTTTIDVIVGDKVQLYGDSTSISSYCYFNNYNCIGTRIAGGTAQVKAYGNIMSLIDETGYATLTTLPNQDYVFYGLFSQNTTLSDASGLLLPAETLANSCYREMFSGCASLTTAPALPATTLADWCYGGMFSGCTGLTTAPALPATTLAVDCYEGMFSYCTGLTTAPALPATTLADFCYSQMFWCCTSLTTAPALPATTLVIQCYYCMFYGCTSLSSITCLATAGINDYGGHYNWVAFVASSGTFTKAAGVNWPSGSSGIPTGWTVLQE